MRNLRQLILIWCLLVPIAALAIADEVATMDECVQKCSDVVDIINTKGAEEAIRQVNDKSGAFIWKDTYVYIMDLTATIVAHGPQPKFIGKNLMGLKDPITKNPWYPEVYKRIEAGDNSGWFDYHWKKPNANGIYKKKCYFQRAGELVVFSGIYGEKVK